MEEKKVLFTGLIEEARESDWVLSGSSEAVLNKIRKMKKLYPDAIIYSQRTEPRYATSCTKFSAMIAFSTNFAKTLTHNEINEIEDASIAQGFKIGYGRPRASGVNTVRKRWNRKNIKNEVETYIVDIFSPEREAYMDSGNSAVVSIKVDATFVNDVALDGDIDGKDFGKTYGHATTVRRLENGLYEFLDSAFGKNGKYTIEKERLQELIAGGNLQNNAHIILPINIITMITKDVPSGQTYSEAVKWMIEDKITTEIENFRPHDNVTRAEMSMFMKRLYDLIKKELH